MIGIGPLKKSRQVVGFGVLLAAGGLAYGIWRFQQNPFGAQVEVSPAQLFEGLFAKPAPAGITNLRGKAIAWLDHQYTLAFVGKPDVVHQLLTPEYDRVTCGTSNTGDGRTGGEFNPGEVIRQVVADLEIDPPSSLAHVECYVKPRVVECNHKVNCHLAYDPTSETAFLFCFTCG